MYITKEFMCKLESEAERVAMEMADYYEKLTYPLNEYYHVSMVMYDRDGSICEFSHDSIDKRKMFEHYMTAEQNHFEMYYDDETNGFIFKKTFHTGRQRVITYTPYKK